jgi:hypothetical protein
MIMRLFKLNRFEEFYLTQNNLSPCLNLYYRVKGGFVSQGGSLTAWCRKHEVDSSSARAALVGSWNGPKGKALREKLIESSGITETPSSLDQTG